MSERNLERAKIEFADLGFKVVTGARYLGGFIGSQAMQTEWIAEKVVEWEASVQILAKAARSCPQTSFAGLQKSSQHEWQYLQRVTADIDADF
eukprot:scaffold299795_cov75-Attheya_sp.AAC.2